MCCYEAAEMLGTSALEYQSDGVYALLGGKKRKEILLFLTVGNNERNTVEHKQETLTHQDLLSARMQQLAETVVFWHVSPSACCFLLDGARANP